MGMGMWMQHAMRRCSGNALTGECLPIRVHVQLGSGITCVPQVIKAIPGQRSQL